MKNIQVDYESSMLATMHFGASPFVLFRVHNLTVISVAVHISISNLSSLSHIANTRACSTACSLFARCRNLATGAAGLCKWAFAGGNLLCK